MDGTPIGKFAIFGLTFLEFAVSRLHGGPGALDQYGFHIGISVQRFSGLSALLYNDPRTSGYLMAQMRLQKLAADILQQVTAAADMDLPV